MLMRHRHPRLRCCFCGKSSAKVARLIAGARGGHICDGCVGACTKILETTPSSFAGWEAMSDAQLLDALGPCSATVEATRRVLHTQVDALRARGVSWELIGRALGVSRQAAWERFS